MAHAGVGGGKERLALPLPLLAEWFDSSIFIAIFALGLTIAIAAFPTASWKRRS